MPVHLRTLGGLSLSGGGLPAAAQQRRRLAFLALLARAPEGRMSRDKLLAQLWPEATEGAARHALDQLLYATRRDLGRDAIRTEDGQLRLDLDAIRADCVEFERCIARGDLKAAAGIYGGQFLDGFNLSDTAEFERWVDTERAALHAQYTRVLERLGNEAHARGDTAAAVGWWRQWAAADPYDTRAAVALADALVATGDRAGALRQLQWHARLMEADLGIAPDPALMSRVREILWHAGDASAAPAVVTSPAFESAKAEESSASEKAQRADRAEERSKIPVLTKRARLALGAAGAFLGVLVLLFAVRALRPTGHGPGSGYATSEMADRSAQRIYLRARLAWEERSQSGLERAVVLFRRAIQIDPASAPAYAGLAQSYVLLGYHGYLPGNATFPKGRAAAERAIALDPECGEAYAALGMALQWEKRWADAEQAFRRSVELAPEDATAHQWYALLLTILGRNEEAVVHGRRAAELDPLSIQINNTYGIMLYNVAQLDSALRVYERIVSAEPDSAWVFQNPWVLDNFGKVSAAAGRYEQALELLRAAAGAVPGHPRPLYHLAGVQLARGDTTAARRAFSDADRNHPYYRMYRGMLEARLGNVEGAFDWFDHVAEWGQPVLNVLVNEADLAELRDHPGYAVLLRRIGLPESLAQDASERRFRKPRAMRGTRDRDG